MPQCPALSPVMGQGLYRAPTGQQPQLGDTAVQWPAPPQDQQEPALLSLVLAWLATKWNSMPWPLLTHTTHTEIYAHCLLQTPCFRTPQQIHASQGGHILAPQGC